MSVELTNMKAADKAQPPSDKLLLMRVVMSSVVENPAQEVGTIDNLPRVYSTYVTLN